MALKGSLNKNIAKKEPLEIANDFLSIAYDKIVIAHYAKHDIKVLSRFFKSLNRLEEFNKIEFECSFELSKRYFKNLKDYSLSFLSKSLNLKVDNNYFDENLAHRAEYDAKFTYELYKKIKEEKMTQEIKAKKNPFSSSRVDTPFQSYPDITKIYQNEFGILLNTLNEIKEDRNSQTKGVVIIGGAGSGKTHLIMRLAKERMKSNRLFFIRQPNNANSVLYHIYNRMLESFFEKVPNISYTQLELMLGKTFSNIVIESIKQKPTKTKTDENMVKILNESALNIYEKFGRDGSDTKRKNWKILEKKALFWWEQKYGFGGLSSNILKGLIKFCTYSDTNKRDIIKRWLIAGESEKESIESVGLDNWSENIDKEDFALEAISTFGKLSLVDEPLILVFDQLEGLKNKEDIAFSFGEALKEIFTQVPNSLVVVNLFPDRWEYFKNIYDSSVIDRVGEKRVYLETPSKENLKTILDLRLSELNTISEEFFDKDEFDDIVNSNSIREALVKASNYFSAKIYGIKTSFKKRDTQKEIQERLKNIEYKIDKILNHLNLVDRELQTLTKKETINSEIDEYFGQTYNYLYKDFYQKAIFTESDDIGKLQKYIDNFSQVFTKEYKKDYLKFGKRVLPQNIIIEKNSKKIVIAFLYVGGNSFTARIQNLNHLVLAQKDTIFYLLRDSRSEPLKSKIAKIEIAKFSNCKNANYIEIGKDKRVIFDLLDKLIDDIDNKDFDTNKTKAIKSYCEKFKNFWLVEVLS